MSFAASSAAGAAAVFFAFLMVFQRSLYSAAVCLLIVLLQTSVLFYFFGSPLLAFLQILIYAGAVMVLVVVTIMASPVPAENRWAKLSLSKPLAAAGFLLPVLEIGVMAARGAPAPAAAAAGAPGPLIGAVLFGPFALATEAAALLLFFSALVLVGNDGQPDDSA